jgi:hypothetical protein
MSIDSPIPSSEAHPEPGPSARVSLEVALLTSETDDASVAASGGKRVVWVATADPDLRAYVRQCLRPRQDLRVTDSSIPPTGVSLMISDRMHVDPIFPLLLLTEDRFTPLVGARRVEVLTPPFNARQLLGAVDRLLGPA